MERFKSFKSVRLRDITKFEKQNPTIYVTVLGYNDWGNVYPLRNVFDREHVVVLMLFEKDEVNHYCLVENLSRLFSSQISKHKEKTHFCLRCLNHYWCEKALEKHSEYCRKHGSVKITMPDEKKKLFPLCTALCKKNFECYNVSINTCQPNPEVSYTKQYQKHVPFGFCYHIKSLYEEVYKSKTVTYTGKDAAQKFVNILREDIEVIAILPDKKMEELTQEQQDQYGKATTFWVCDGNLTKDNHKVRDHCHYTGSSEELRITYVIYYSKFAKDHFFVQ